MDYRSVPHSIPGPSTSGRRWLPPIGSTRYHLLLICVAMFILGPLGGVSAAYMNFSLGFFVGGQVLAGILGSAVIYGYGSEGKHGANYMQTLAASVVGIAGMAVLIQAMVWLGLPQPPAWKLIVYFTSIGMFGVGVGMWFTPVLVDRMQLTFPSGYAVANILRALTDRVLLKRSVAQLGGSAAVGYLGGLAALQSLAVQSTGASMSNLGAGMVVGPRIGIPAVVMGLIGLALTPWLRRIGWLGPDDPYRRIGFVIALGTILGAAAVDIALIGAEACRRLRQGSAREAVPAGDWKHVNAWALVVWVVAWGAAVVWCTHGLLGQPLAYTLISVGLVFVFVLINGISTGISDWNPISSAFVVTVFLLAACGLRDPVAGLLCGGILLVATSVAVDMQQNRSTGWRLGTNRVVQFRYQVVGIVMGAVMAVGLASVFMNAFPVLRQDTFTHPNLEGAQQWQSAMTYKFVGALKGITNPRPEIMSALQIGLGIGVLTESLRKFIKSRPAYRAFSGTSTGRRVDFVLDAFLLPSPYASSFGGFVEFITTVWFAAGGVVGSLTDAVLARRQARRAAAGEAASEIPADMSATSLVGGGLIAGDSLAALSVGGYGLLRTLM